MAREAERVILVEPDEDRRSVLAERLRSQGYQVDALASGVEAATLALASPPSAVVADLWMPGVSGVQLCRLLRSELATEGVPVILRGPSDTPRQRFWAARAGAAAYVVKGRIGELVRSLSQSIGAATSSDGFFQIHPDDVDNRDRISQQLDRALYDSVLASEVRALSTSDSFPRLFDLLSQFLCQVTTYRWLAVFTHEPRQLCVHAYPGGREQAITEARQVLEVSAEVPLEYIEDEDASAQGPNTLALRRELSFGTHDVGRVAMMPMQVEEEDALLMDIVKAELGGPIRIVTLVEQTRRLASHDALTGILNRRALTAAMEREISQAERLNVEVSFLLLDVDHFKSVNDTHGHQSGDRVLAAMGQLLGASIRDYDYAARWGGEEFVLVLPHTGAEGALKVGERTRAAIEALELQTPDGAPLPITASIGVATRETGESFDALVERADKAMYAAKSGGRNRVVAAPSCLSVARVEGAARPTAYLEH